MSVPAFVKKRRRGSRLVAPKFDKARQSIAMGFKQAKDQMLIKLLNIVTNINMRRRIMKH